MLPYLVGGIIVGGLPTLYFAVRYREYRKFLAGAFFVKQRDAILLLLGEDPDPPPVDDRDLVPGAQRRARHDPLCALSCLFVFWVVLPQTPRRLNPLRTQ
jgi:hypothetical protein